jgi:hypothetical protein
MELTLNLVWLVISIASVAFGIRRVSALAPGPERRRFAVDVSFALLFVLLLLFPVISITDDLHWDSVTAEEWSATKRGPSLSAARSIQHHSTPTAAALIVPILLGVLLVLLYGVDSEPAFFAPAILDNRSRPRSPPATLSSR